MTLHALTLHEARSRIGAGTLTVLDYANALLDRIGRTDANIEAWAWLDAKAVRREAMRLDGLPAAQRGALHGIPVGLKDIIHTASMPTGLGSETMLASASRHDAACVKRLLDAGAYAFGKTVTTELAFMHPGKTRNPWNAAHTPGGSSQGSAAAVAAGHVPAALGTQTNGSVIRPAAYCGVVGFKPTLGAIPFRGVNLFSETLDTLGTFTRSVADAALLASVLVGDTFDSTLETPPKLALLDEFPWTPVDCDADDTLEAGATKLRVAGADIESVFLPEALRDTPAVHRTIMLHEAARNLGELQQRHRAQFSATLNAALDEGRAISTRDYESALRRRSEAVQAAGEWMAAYDAVIAPPTPAGAPVGLERTGDPSCCTFASLLGAPAVSLPIAFDAARMPLGMQLLASPGADARLLAIAAWCEARLPFRGLA